MKPLVVAAVLWAAPGPAKDTAGYKFLEVWKQVAEKYPDAALLSINGRASADGWALCDPRAPMTDGWRYHFHSARYGAYLLMGRCEDVIAGPLQEIRSAKRLRPYVAGKFIDSDRALRVLKDSGVSLDPADHKGGGKRPFALTLEGASDPRFKDHPVFWSIRIGQDLYMVNADTQKLLRELSPAEAGGAASHGVQPHSGAGSTKTAAGAGSGPASRPARPKGYTARTDLEKVRRYVQARMSGAMLMGIDGIADARGAVACTGPGDGWAYYYYWPKTRDIEAVHACDGAVGPGRATYVPVSLNLHDAVSGDFIDSDKAMELLLAGELGAMSEGLGRDFTRKAAMRLLRHRSPPFSEQGLWNVRLLWELDVGTNVFYVDALKGVYIGLKEKY